MQKQAEAISYAALLLHDIDQPITEESVEKLCAKAGIKLTKGLATAFVRASKGTVKSWISVGGGAAAAPQAGNAQPQQAAKKEEKPVEVVPEPEEDVDMGGLFD